MKEQKGITLVALVITIVVLLILAGVVLSSMQQSGIIGKAKEAKTEYSMAGENETAELENYSRKINQYIHNNEGGDSGTFTFTLNQLGTPDSSFTDSILEFDINIASSIFDIDLTKYFLIITTDDSEFNQAISNLCGGEFMMYACAEVFSTGTQFSLAIQGGNDDIVVNKDPNSNQMLYTDFLSAYGNVEFTATAMSMESGS